MEYHSAIKREKNIAICDSMDEPGEDYAKWYKPEIGIQVLYHLYVEYIKNNSNSEIESRMVVASSWEWEKWGDISQGAQTFH